VVRKSAVAVENLNNFTVRDNAGFEDHAGSLRRPSDQILNGTGRETFEAVALLQSIQKTPYQPKRSELSEGHLGDSMRQIAS